MKKKLSLNKVKIARLENSRAIRGGSIIIVDDGPYTTSIVNQESVINNQCTTSTKTTPIGPGGIDPNDL